MKAKPVSKRKRGDARMRVVPEAVLGIWRNIACAVMQGPSKAEWDFEKG